MSKRNENTEETAIWNSLGGGTTPWLVIAFSLKE